MACRFETWRARAGGSIHRVNAIFHCECPDCHAAVRAALANETPEAPLVKERWGWLVREPAPARSRA